MKCKDCGKEFMAYKGQMGTTINDQGTHNWYCTICATQHITPYVARQINIDFLMEKLQPLLDIEPHDRSSEQWRQCGYLREMITELEEKQLNLKN